MPPEENYQLLLQSRKLPDEETLRDYIERVLEIPDPYSPQVFSSMSETIKSQMDCMYTPFLVDYWPGPTWADAGLKPDIVSPEDPSEEDIDTPIPTLLLDTNVASLCRNSAGDSFHILDTAINSGTNLVRINHFFHRWTSDCKILQHELLMQELKNKGYSAHRGDPEIITEVDRIGDQHPGSQVWVICGRGISNYYNGIRHQEGPRLPEDAHLITVAHSNNNLELFETAIFSDKQIRTSQSFTYSYAIKRVPRQWEIQALLHMKFSLEVTPREDFTQTTTRINAPRRTSQAEFRFGNLE